MLLLIVVAIFLSRRWYWHGYGPYAYGYYGQPYGYGYVPYGAYSQYDPYWRQRYYGYHPWAYRGWGY